MMMMIDFKRACILANPDRSPWKEELKQSAISDGKAGASSSTGRAISWLNAANWDVLSAPSASDAWMERVSSPCPIGSCSLTSRGTYFSSLAKPKKGWGLQTVPWTYSSVP